MWLEIVRRNPVKWLFIGNIKHVKMVLKRNMLKWLFIGNNKFNKQLAYIALGLNFFEKNDYVMP